MPTDFSIYHLSDRTRRSSSAIPGPKSLELLALQEKFEGAIVSYPKGIPIALRRAKGAIVEDVDGNLFIDLFSMAGVLNLGHCNHEVIRYAQEQESELIHALDFPTQNKADLVKNILGHLPANFRDEYKVSFVGPTGSDAIEAAVKLAKLKTGRETLIAFSGSYHGMTSGALALTSDVRFRARFASLSSNIHFIPYSYCYRCPFGKNSESCTLDCANYLRSVLEDSHSGIPKPAAIVLEPIQGEGGNIVPKNGYLEAITNVAREHGVITIFDEIQAGFFRSGEFLSFMSSNAAPDIITISKGLGGVGFPISAIVYRRGIEAWHAGDHVGTFRGNQVSIAAANGAFDFIDRHRVDENVAARSEQFFTAFKRIQENCPYLGDVRGKGLMIGLEFVVDRSSKKPFPEIALAIKKRSFQRGLIFEIGGHHSNVIRILPPLIITAAIAQHAIDLLEEVINDVTAEQRSRQ